MEEPIWSPRNRYGATHRREDSLGGIYSATHRRDDSWQDLDVFQTYHSKHHQYLSLTESKPGVVKPTQPNVQSREENVGSALLREDRSTPSASAWFSKADRRAGVDAPVRSGLGRLWAFSRVSVLLAVARNTVFYTLQERGAKVSG